MKAREFCLWLYGFLDGIAGITERYPIVRKQPAISEENATKIRQELLALQDDEPAVVTVAAPEAKAVPYYRPAKCNCGGDQDVVFMVPQEQEATQRLQGVPVDTVPMIQGKDGKWKLARCCPFCTLRELV